MRRIANTKVQNTPIPGDRRLLSDDIASWLIGEIQGGKLPPGSRIPSERDLAESLSVSRSVIREALSQLKSDGLVETRKGRGIYVNTAEQYRSFRLDEPSTLTTGELHYIFEFLLTFEVAATRYAALRRTAENLKEIEKSMIGMDYAIANELPTADHDFAFHRAIVKASKNPHFLRLNQHLENTVRRFIRAAAANTASNHKHLIPQVRQEHQSILQAIRDGDPNAAEQAATVHLQNVAQRLNTKPARQPRH